MPIRKVTKLGVLVGASTDFDITETTLTRLNAVQPVSVMARRFEEVYFIVRQRILKKLLRIAEQDSTVNAKHPTGSREHNAACAAMGDFNTIWHDEAGALSLRWVIRWENLHWPRCIRAKTPLHDVVHVGTDIRVPATRKLAVVTPCGEVIMASTWAQHR